MVKKSVAPKKKKQPKKVVPLQTQRQTINIINAPTKRKKGKSTKTNVNQKKIIQPQPSFNFAPSFNYPPTQYIPPSVNYQSSNIIPPPVSERVIDRVSEPSLVPVPVEPIRTTSLPSRIGSAVGSAVGSAILSTGSVVLSSVFWPPDVARSLPPELPPFAPEVAPVEVAPVERQFAPIPFPLVPYSPPPQFVPLPSPRFNEEEVFYDINEDPFNLEQPAPEIERVEEEKDEPIVLGETKEEPKVQITDTLPLLNPFNVDQSLPAPLVENEPESFYTPSQIEDLKKQTALYTSEERLAQPPVKSLTELLSLPASEGPKQPKKKVVSKSPVEEAPQLTPKQFLAKQRKEEEKLAKKEAKQQKALPVKDPFEFSPEEEAPKPNPFGFEPRGKVKSGERGLERVRPQTEPEYEDQPLQYGFSN